MSNASEIWWKSPCHPPFFRPKKATVASEASSAVTKRSTSSKLTWARWVIAPLLQVGQLYEWEDQIDFLNVWFTIYLELRVMI